ncbi:MAG: glycosyl hydrolase [Gemmatimonadetes bacterium]|nr:glycosyl hydrolase [Gemmatimonadota bacterium]
MSRLQRSLAFPALFVSALTVSAAGRGPASAPKPAVRAAGSDSALLAALKWRNVGPDRGGRSIAVSGVRGRPKEAYFGAVGGGLWKTTDAGENWAPVTDGQVRSASVGAVAVSESNPDIVFIGMGETCIRGNIMAGDGVYKSSDAGKTWTHVGFAASENIAKIRIHPTNADIIWVAAFGKHSAPNAERGVYKSTDGGKNWRRVLFRNDSTGAIDLTVDRNNPNVLYAALWQAYRTEYTMSSGGAGSGLFKSTDGGETWTEITRNPGMPAGLVGRIGVSVSPVNSNRVYALVENAKGGLFKSDDAGATWSLTTESRNVRQRAFYYTHVTADSKNADVVYMLNTSAFRSDDQGKTMVSVGNGTHGDHHDLWVDPDDPKHLVIGNDGGGAVSMNGGQRWSEEDFPTEQFYRVATTAHIPYHLCGSQQDNSTLCIPFNWNLGPARGRQIPGLPEGRAPQVWYTAGGGEPGYMAPDPKNPDLYFAGTNNGGFLDKYDRRLGQGREVNPYPWMYSGEPSSEIRERWQWTYPIIFSPANPNLLYVSSQRVWMTPDGGKTWKAISGDLTRHDPKTMGHSGGPITGDMNGPEVYAVIFALGPGKKNANVLWTGSDDGLVHVTRDGGATWTNVTPKEMPAFGRVSQIDASAFNDGAAYVSVRRPLMDDTAPYIFATVDYGKTWRKIVNGIRADDYVHTVREDPWRRGLLYAAAQHGVYVSSDDGAHWTSLRLNMPDAPVSDLLVKENELVISSHGRGFWVLDNASVLRQATPATIASADPYLFVPPVAYRSGLGATINYWLKTPAKSVTIDVLDAAGNVIRTFAPDTGAAAAAAPAAGGRRFGFTAPPPRTAGVHRFTWDLNYAGATTFPGMILWGATTAGPAAAPGRYAVRLSVDGKTQIQPITVRRNPWNTEATDADLQAQFALAIKIRDKVSEANQAVVDIRNVKGQVADRLKRANDAALKGAGDRLVTNAADVEDDVYQVQNQSNQDPLNFPIKINNRLASLLRVVSAGDGRPTSNIPEIFAIQSAQLKVQTDKLAQVWKADLAAFNKEAARLKLPPVDPKCAKAEGCVVQP